MKVIDANTGLVLKENMTFTNVNGRTQVLKIVPGIFRAHAVLFMPDSGRPPFKQPLQVRWVHPFFFLQHVAFLPS